MSRNRASARAAGTRFERTVADYLAAALEDDRIDRRVQNGAKDRGDIGGIRTRGGDRVVIECKDAAGQLKAGTWIGEAQVEAGNDDAAIGVVVAKRRGTAVPAEQWCLMTLADLAYLLGADQPELNR